MSLWTGKVERIRAMCAPIISIIQGAGAEIMPAAVHQFLQGAVFATDCACVSRYCAIVEQLCLNMAIN